MQPTTIQNPNIQLTISTFPVGNTSEFETLFWALTSYGQELEKQIADSTDAESREHFKSQKEFSDELIRSLNLNLLAVVQQPLMRR